MNLSIYSYFKTEPFLCLSKSRAGGGGGGGGGGIHQFALKSGFRPISWARERPLLFSSLVLAQRWVLVYKPKKDLVYFPCGTSSF